MALLLQARPEEERKEGRKGEFHVQEKVSNKARGENAGGSEGVGVGEGNFYLTTSRCTEDISLALESREGLCSPEKAKESHPPV